MVTFMDRIPFVGALRIGVKIASEAVPALPPAWRRPLAGGGSEPSTASLPGESVETNGSEINNRSRLVSARERNERVDLVSY
jgi:hypothetical protein